MFGVEFGELPGVLELLELVAQLSVERPKAFEKPVTDGVKRA
jgi:hypothetical protein